MAISKAVDTGRVICEDDLIDTDNPLNKEYLRLQSEKKKTEQDEAISIKDPTRTITKNQADIAKVLVTTANEKVKLAQRIGTLILKEQVVKIFGRLYSVIMNYFHPLGQRLAPIVAGICGVTDSAKIMEIEKAIDEEIMRGITEFKKEVEREI